MAAPISAQPQSHQSSTSFTITQPFLGAPLQFTPALGTKELEGLIEAYVVGSAPKQDKLSEVTIDFYKYATVDISTGALVRRYDVFPSPWASSPSAEFSPQLFTPSPSSSGYNSSFVGQTPPTTTAASRARGSRVAKKPTKKQAQSAAADRLPGFSIMTKDGVDVTTSAGRGTKTKEQREHAHLMRIMKACDACKKKKVRCDPSHRRANTEMSRTSTSTKTSSPSKSPPTSTPSLSQQNSFASQDSMSSFVTPNAINDFVLFPETPSFEWDPADILKPFPELQASELIDFDFDINGIGGLNNFPDQFFDFPAYGAEPKSQPAQPFEYSPFVSDQYGFDQFHPQDFIPVSHATSSHTSISDSTSPMDLQGSLPVCHSTSSHASTSGSPSDSQGSLEAFNTPSLQASSSGSPQDWSPDGYTASLSEQSAFTNSFRLNHPVDSSQHNGSAVSQESPAALHWILSDLSGDIAANHTPHADPGDQVQRPARHRRLDHDKRSNATHERFENSDTVAVANYNERSQVIVESLGSESNQRFASQSSTQPQLLSSECRYQSILANCSDEDHFSPHQDRRSGEDNHLPRQDQESREDIRGHLTSSRNTQLRISSEDCDYGIQTSPQEVKTQFYLPAPIDMGKIVRQTISGQAIGIGDEQLSGHAITATAIISPTTMSSPRSNAVRRSVVNGLWIQQGESSRKDPKKTRTSESRLESVQSVLCTTVPSLQTTVSPLQIIYKPSIVDIFQSSPSPLSSLLSLPGSVPQTSGAHSPAANDTTNPSIVTTTTLDDEHKYSLAMVIVLASLTITALSYLESHATVAGMLLLCAVPVLIAQVANIVLTSCMYLALDLISILSSSTTTISGSGFPSLKSLKAGRRIVSKGFAGSNGRRSWMDVCKSLRIR